VFANRFTALIDACSLAGTLRRNLLLTLAEAEFFRVRWSEPILDETVRAITKILQKKGLDDASSRASKAVSNMKSAFEDAMVTDFDKLKCVCEGLPDPGDAHVIAAALKTQAAVIVSENLKDFPNPIIAPLNLEVLNADVFIADTIALDYGRAVAAIRRMRERFKAPALTADVLLNKMDADGLVETVDVLKHHSESL
jgi:predicted nucleic acid-binding protein